ncbi:hypothetical protein HDU76_001178, partial [Blyttiomyces sp. JEL0837]
DSMAEYDTQLCDLELISQMAGEDIADNEAVGEDPMDEDMQNLSDGAWDNRVTPPQIVRPVIAVAPPRRTSLQRLEPEPTDEEETFPDERNYNNYEGEIQLIADEIQPPTQEELDEI